MYGKGEGIPMNTEMATRWFFQSAQQGDSIAQANIGLRFEEGKHGLPQDDLEAYYWCSLALTNKAALRRADNKNLVSDLTNAREIVENRLDEAAKREIQTQIDNFKPKILSSSGTGFYVYGNYILTNAHVVIKDEEMKQKWDEIRVPYRRVKLMDDWDSEVDLALLYDKRRNEVTAQLRTKPLEEENIGEKIVVFGYPLGLRSLSYEGNVTDGIISGLSYNLEHPTPENGFQHTAPTQRGNSGGPVFDAAGNVVGVCVSIKYDPIPLTQPMGLEIPDTINLAQNINFAIKVEVVKSFLRRVELDDEIERVLEESDRALEEIKRRLENGSISPSRGEPLKERSPRDIRSYAKPFTKPIVCFENKENPPLAVQEIGIKGLEQ